MKALWNHLKSRTVLSYASGILLTSAFISLASIMIPLITTLIFDQIVQVDHVDTLTLALLALLAVVSLIQMLEFVAGVLRLRLQTWVSLALNRDVMERLLSLPTRFFRQYSVGDALTRSGISDFEREHLLISTVEGFLSGLLSASNLFVLFYLSTQIGFISLTVAILAVVIGVMSAFIKTQIERKLHKRKSRLHSFLLQILSAHSKIRAAGAEERVFSNWLRLFRQRQHLGLDSSRIENRTAVFHSLLPGACLACFFWVLGTTDGSLDFSPGQYVAAISSFSLFLNGITRVSSSLMDLARAVPLLELMEPIFHTGSERDDQKKFPHSLKGQIEVKNLSFRYSDETPFTLENINFQIKPGQFVGVVGASGSGKSTLVRLLLGFEKPTSGQILFDGIPLSELDISEVRRQIGTVLQNDQLTAGNIFDNIAAARPLTLEDAQEAARIAGLSNDLAQMPMGMHSFVTHGGGAFSGGERQRIMIARAIAGKPRIVLFDEATSALDNRVQAEVIRNLEKLNITRIIVAHRLSTILHADLILVFDQGRLVESGDLTSLMAQNGIFARLARRQNIDRCGA